jgi:hypothetical protein
MGAAPAVIKSTVFVVHPRGDSGQCREGPALVCIATSLTGISVLKWCLSDVEGGGLQDDTRMTCSSWTSSAWSTWSDGSMAQVGALGRIGS